MTDLTPNTTPDGESCGTCRFAGTHTHSPDRKTQSLVKCRRFPPQRHPVGPFPSSSELAQQQLGTLWPVLSWDDWCGEWEKRDPPEGVTPEPVGFAAPAEDEGS